MGMMSKFSKNFKITLVLTSLIAVVVGMFFLLYLCILPALVQSQSVHSKINELLKEYTGATYIVEKPVLTTGFSTNIAFCADKFLLSKNGQILINIDNINTKFAFAKIFLKKLHVKTLGADSIFIDVNKTLALLPKTEQEAVKSDWSIDFMDSLLYLKKLEILYNVDNKVFFDVDAKNLRIDNTQKKCRYVHFDVRATMKNDEQNAVISVADENKVYIKNHCLYIDNCRLNVNKSTVIFNAWAKNSNKYNLEVFSNNFAVENVVDLVRSNLIIPNGRELLVFFKDIKGYFDFKVVFSNKGLTGDVDLHKLSLLFIPVKDMPVHISEGHITIDEKQIELKEFKGYYGSHKFNNLKFSGSIKDYTNTFDTNITADAIVTDDFAKYYLSEVIGFPINLVGKADTRLVIKSLKGITDLLWLFRIKPDCNLLVGGQPLGKYPVERVLVSKMQVVDTLFHIKSMDYYLTVPGVADYTKRRILSLNGIIDFAKDINFKQMGFDISEPMPSEFLNMIIRSEFFKGGNVIGKLKAVDGPKGVKLFGNIKLDKIRVPSQRLYIEDGTLSTDFNTINISSKGRYRRSVFDLTGSFFNNIGFPIIVNDIVLSVDNLNVERILRSFNAQGTQPVQPQKQPETDLSDNSDDTMPTFDLSNLIIKKCSFNLNKGSYKLINFGDLHANMSLDEKSVLKLDSNRFNFADGQSSCHVNCDLKNHNYRVVLGVKDVNSDVVATSLLNLPKEISGKATGTIDLNTDESLKLNGSIRFVVKDGAIGKIGLIQYVLNLASVFRNPLAMISPATIFDLVNIPDGNFEKIQGMLILKNNIIDDIKIKSFAPMLSAYIVGRYDLEKADATLRIYTRLSNKHKGIYGVLRYLSLSSLASRVSLGSRNDANYYSSELAELPEINADEKDCQVFITRVEGDLEHFNFLSSLKKIK